jgi:diadenosine tetraphosphate (Ap4A) HIT family hydrolase
MVCEKHHDFEPIAELDGFYVSHFPIISGEPATRGHLLIEAKRHIIDPVDLSDDEAKALGVLIRNSIRMLIKGIGAEHAYVFRLNDRVPHFHVHIVPRFSNTPKEYWGHKITEWPGALKLDLSGVKALTKKLKSIFS